MSDLRTRIAEIIDREVDGLWEPLAVADALIRELGLHREDRLKPDGSVWSSRYVTPRL